MENDKILNITEVSEYLKVSITQVYRLIENESLPVIYISDKSPRVRMSDLQKWLTAKLSKDNPLLSNNEEKGGEKINA